MTSQKKFLLFGLVPALIFQTIGATLYFDLWAEGTGAKIIYSLTKVLLLIWPLLWWKYVKTPLKITPHKAAKEIAWGLSTGLFLSLGILLVFTVFPEKDLLTEQIQEKIDAYFGMSAALYLLFSVFLCVGHSLLEEYYWRWFTGSGLKQTLPKMPALFLTNLGFAAHHFIILNSLTTGTWAVFGTFGVFAGGVIWSLLHEKTQSLFAPWLSHLCVDVTLMGIAYYLLF
ncbi:CPBP family intramembrane metalloprotease [Candidatus Peregrinibacteria bacterium]|nr:MAG: CPBP family intramembrane metalloprotease [Candidatus Peregrinibacteria bacterium]